MELIERSMDEAGAVHVMLEWLKVRNTNAYYIANISFRKSEITGHRDNKYNSKMKCKKYHTFRTSPVNVILEWLRV